MQPSAWVRTGTGAAGDETSRLTHTGMGTGTVRGQTLGVRACNGKPVDMLKKLKKVAWEYNKEHSTTSLYFSLCVCYI